MWRKDSVLLTSRVSMPWGPCLTECRLTEDDYDGQLGTDKRDGTNLRFN